MVDDYTGLKRNDVRISNMVRAGKYVYLVESINPVNFTNPIMKDCYFELELRRITEEKKLGILEFKVVKSSLLSDNEKRDALQENYVIDEETTFKGMIGKNTAISLLKIKSIMEISK